jgi:hypothetical protein
MQGFLPPGMVERDDAGVSHCHRAKRQPTTPVIELKAGFPMSVGGGSQPVDRRVDGKDSVGAGSAAPEGNRVACMAKKNRTR